MDAVDDDDDETRVKDVGVENARRSASKSLTESRVVKVRSVRSLLRAVNKAAMRVNPNDPDAFLALLSRRVGHAEQLDIEPDVYDEAVQTEQPLPVPVDTGSSARIKQLEREMVDLQSQARLTEVIAYAMLPIAAVLVLLFAGKLWTSYSSYAHMSQLS